MLTSLTSIVKYFSLMIGSSYLYTKLNNKKFKALDLLGLLFSIIMSIALYFATTSFKSLLPFLILFCVCIYSKLRFSDTFYNTVTISIIAFGITIFLHTLSIFVSLPFSLFIYLIKDTELKTFLIQIIINLLQLLLSYLLFKIRRFKSGVKPIQNSGSFELLLLASLVSIFAMSLYYTENAKTTRPEIVILFILFCGLALTIWWRKHITNVYVQHVTERNTQILESANSILAKDYQNSESDRIRLASIVHRDNKIVPAMLETVETVAAESPGAKTDVLLKALREMSAERKGLLADCNARSNRPQTGDGMLDGMLLFLQNSAQKRRVRFTFALRGDMQILDGRIERTQFNTIFTDLGENAFIAAGENGNAFAEIDLEGDCPLIRFYDDGAHFAANVIAGLGKKRITTHRETGGSGIGMFTLFEILRKYNASFRLDEKPDKLPYTKCITIAFDGLNECKIRTEREEIKALRKTREDIVFE